MTPVTQPSRHDSQLGPVLTQVASAQALFAQVLETALRAGPVSVEQYCR